MGYQSMRNLVVRNIGFLVEGTLEDEELDSDPCLQGNRERSLAERKGAADTCLGQVR